MRFSRGIILASAAALVATLASCGGASEEVTPAVPSRGAGKLVEITGVIRHSNLEGGSYVIRSDDGVTYDPINLPAEFREDGVLITAQARLRHDMLGVRQSGSIVELIHIQRR